MKTALTLIQGTKSQHPGHCCSKRVLAKFILGRNVKGTGRKNQSGLGFSPAPAFQEAISMIRSLSHQPPTPRGGLAGTGSLPGWEGGQTALRQGAPRLQAREGPRSPDFCAPRRLVVVTEWGPALSHWGLGYLLSWHTAGLSFPAALHLAGVPMTMTISCQWNRNASEVCYLGVEAC